MDEVSNFAAEFGDHSQHIYDSQHNLPHQNHHQPDNGREENQENLGLNGNQNEPPLLLLLSQISLESLASPLATVGSFCSGILFLFMIQYQVLGPLRASEQQIFYEAFKDYAIRKGLFYFFILTKIDDGATLWPAWFVILGATLLSSRLCQDRFEYLASSPISKKWALIKISVLMAAMMLLAISCNVYVLTHLAKEFSTTLTLFLLADSSYALIYVSSVVTRFIVLGYDMMNTDSVWENRNTIIHYSDLIFAMLLFIIDLLHYTHLCLWTDISVSIKICCAFKIHAQILEIRRRYKQHTNYLLVVNQVNDNFPMASEEEIRQNSDDCAICWDEMDSARKLPCGHLFHNCCLRSWLEQDASCPTCRTLLKFGQEGYVDEIERQLSDREEEFAENNIRLLARQRDHFFRFDSSRYTNHPFLSWLPTVSIEGFM